MSNHIEQPTTGIVQRVLLETALSEGSSGFWDDCGPDANCMVGRINHLLSDSEYNGATIAAIRERDINSHHMNWPPDNPGQTLDDIRWDIETFSHNQRIIQYAPYAQPGDWAAMHGWLKQYAGIAAILFQVLQAHNLPHNEPGVFSHFVCCSGINSTLGYMILNGDTVDDQGHNYLGKCPGNWATVMQLIPANIAGMIVVQRNDGATSPANATLPWV
jgi:hypothetical protein